MLSVVDFYVLAGAFRTVYGFRGFRYLADVAFECFRGRCGFRFLGRPDQSRSQ